CGERSDRTSPAHLTKFIPSKLFGLFYPSNSRYITTGDRIGYEQGKKQGQQEQAQTLVLRLLKKRVGELPQQVREQIQGLSLEQLEALGEALLNFNALA
ncbi:MAG: DUF4351 domain-containing protein, partial [Nostoc sp.]|uniref:DUF4351 domain-containing protein n=1 Tax=Nostoc sp. TaxID=1180 RepID=UPI002FF71A28